MEDNPQGELTGDNKSGDSEVAQELKQQENIPIESGVTSDLENTQAEAAEGMPQIDILELAKVLRDPNMPSQKIMNEVADHMVMMAGQKENSSDGSDSEGLKRVVDCIIEVCLRHEDSDKSDDDDDDYYEEDQKILREIPCKFCNKIFNSSMTCKTHILVAHPQQDPSMLNIKYLSEREVNKKNSSRRRSSRCSSKAEADTKSLQASEKAAHEETKATLTRQCPITALQSSPLPGLSSEPLQAASESKLIQEESAPCMESTDQPKVSIPTETCDTNVRGSISSPMPGASTEAKCESSDPQWSEQPIPQGDNNSPSISNSPQASKHKLLESDSYADTPSKKSRVDSSDVPTS